MAKPSGDKAVVVGGYQYTRRQLKKCLGFRARRAVTKAIKDDINRHFVRRIKADAPVDTGTLRKKIKSQAQIRGASIKIGTKRKATYANYVINGAPKYRQLPNDFVFPNVRAGFVDFIADLNKTFERFQAQCTKDINRNRLR